MNCKACQYPLWNLTARVCPECGTPFAPSDYDFSLNSVRFMCPHCSQAYYGTGERGHLVPDEFDCVKCQRRVRMDEMVLLPTEGVAEEQTRAEGSPWIERKGRLLVPWLRTIGWAMFQPTRLMRATPPESSAGAAAGFAAITNGIYACIGFGGIMALVLVMGLLFGGGAGFGSGWWTLPIMLISWVLGLAVFISLWTLIAHGLLKMTGATAAGMGRTAHAICYASAANIVIAVPCLNIYFGWVGVICWVIWAAIMAAEAQRVGAWRAILAVVVPPMALIGIPAAWFIYMIGIAMTAAGTASSTWPSGTAGQSAAMLSMARPAETQMVLDALLAFGRAHAGAPPDHAARLIEDRSLMFTQLVAGGSGTDPARLTVDGSALYGLAASGGNGAAAIGRAAAALPPGTVAYRLGDYVFTCPGINLATGDPGLWVVVCAPDQATAARIPGAVVPIGRLGGTVTPIASSDFPRALAGQNELRATFGLAPLPDPALVKDGIPAVGSAGGQ